MPSFTHQSITGNLTGDTMTGVACRMQERTLAGLIGWFSGVSGTVAGTLKIQVSNDSEPNGAMISGGGWQPPEDSWVDAPSGSVTVNANGGFTFAPVELAYRWCRVVYVPTSGVGGALRALLHLAT